VEFKIELAAPDQSIQYTNKKGVEIIAPRLVVSRAKTAWGAWDQLWRHH